MLGHNGEYCMGLLSKIDYCFVPYSTLDYGTTVLGHNALLHRTIVYYILDYGTSVLDYYLFYSRIWD